MGVDLTAAGRGDTLIGGDDFQAAGTIIRMLTFSNAEIRKAWGNLQFNVIYGDENPWPIIWAIWQLEAEAEKTGFPIEVRRMPGVNHLVSLHLLFTTIGTYETRACTIILSLSLRP